MKITHELSVQIKDCHTGIMFKLEAQNTEKKGKLQPNMSCLLLKFLAQRTFKKSVNCLQMQPIELANILRVSLVSDIKQIFLLMLLKTKVIVKHIHNTKTR